MAALLSATGLKKNYGSLEAVRGIQLTVDAGECFALLGPNGAGKTTTVEMLEGLEKPDSGEITIFGQNLATQKRSIMEKVGVMLQETHLYKKFSVAETVSLFASFFRSPLGVDEAIAQVGLTEKKDSRLEHLSGGQKQRVYLACSLINDPELLFLDEPTTGLDPQSRRMIWQLIASRKKSGKGIFLTTHYMDEAEQLADRIAIIDHGEIIAEGSPKELIERYVGEHTLSFAFQTINEHQLSELKSKLPWLASAKFHEDSYEVAMQDSIEQMNQLIQECEKIGLKLSKVEMHRSTLEDVFLNLTGRSIRDA